MKLAIVLVLAALGPLAVGAFSVLPNKARSPPRKGFSLSLSSVDSTDQVDAIVASHPVLQKVYPALLKHIELYGHPNIPLGSPEGKACETLRRVQLPPAVVNLLDGLNFRWESLENAYDTSDFDTLFQRLHDYSARYNTSPPKKYATDPELGAWVTALRRIGPTGVAAEHVQRLEQINFEWQTTQRKCGSAFMKEYRAIKQQLDDVGAHVWTIPKVKDWMRAQQLAKDRLSETRQHYMDTLRSDWRTWEP